jgi:hypothetical protein
MSDLKIKKQYPGFYRAKIQIELKRGDETKIVDAQLEIEDMRLDARDSRFRWTWRMNADDIVWADGHTEDFHEYDEDGGYRTLRDIKQQFATPTSTLRRWKYFKELHAWCI